jgi:hypothetical protein
MEQLRHAEDQQGVITNGSIELQSVIKSPTIGAPDRQSRPPSEMVPAGAPVHRGARDVAGGGVGINLAIQDAVAAANRLVGPLRSGAVSERDLSDVQRRRMFPTRATQADTNLHPRQVSEPRVAESHDPNTALVCTPAGPLVNWAANSRPHHRSRIPARARPHAQLRSPQSRRSVPISRIQR